ncbi:MAG: prephenate dehydrogenase/arogenate dehydrogenase family protein [Candidatus Eremiobacteraeota bacterium]|nr:prephenate dehydrogenase/arogenate dehydrogenase family protein [Candidatus Eremiobacteraeota bacterium]MBV9647608.1 prephenate dehydrogenase/arogenate dehydrogenase family protein [Candidatus Eremiobacteraeota bacterium]
MLVGILGTGLIGSSVGLAARAAGDDTFGWDGNGAAASEAAAIGALCAIGPSPEAVAAESDVVVVALPLAATVELLARLPASRHAGLVIDVASVKQPVLTAAARVPYFVASHPIAGSERRGPAAARRDLFSGRVWAYVPPRDRELEARAREFFKRLGATPVAVDAETHDRTVAFTSHLPQVVATALGASLAERADDRVLRALCGTGMLTMTRLALSSWTVWEGIFAANAAPVHEEVRAFAGILGDTADAIRDGERGSLSHMFQRAAAGAATLRENVGAPGLVIDGTERHQSRGSP